MSDPDYVTNEPGSIASRYERLRDVEDRAVRIKQPMRKQFGRDPAQWPAESQRLYAILRQEARAIRHELGLFMHPGAVVQRLEWQIESIVAVNARLHGDDKSQWPPAAINAIIMIAQRLKEERKLVGLEFGVPYEIAPRENA
jgi:hypothetical protein